MKEKGERLATVCSHGGAALRAVVTAGGRRPKFRPLFGALVRSKRTALAAHRRRLPIAAVVQSERVAAAGYNMGLSASRRKLCVLAGEGNACPDTTRRVSLSFHGTPRRVGPTCQSPYPRERGERESREHVLSQFAVFSRRSRCVHVEAVTHARTGRDIRFRPIRFYFLTRRGARLSRASYQLLGSSSSNLERTRLSSGFGARARGRVGYLTIYSLFRRRKTRGVKRIDISWTISQAQPSISRETPK